jgi:hypothetical protein
MANITKDNFIAAARFKETGIIDKAGNTWNYAANAPASQNVALSRPGIFGGRSMRHVGSSSAVLPRVPVKNGDWTFSAWLKSAVAFPEPSGEGSFAFFWFNVSGELDFVGGMAADAANKFRMASGWNEPEAGISVDGDMIAAFDAPAMAGAYLNTWNHIAWVRKGNAIKFALNGTFYNIAASYGAPTHFSPYSRTLNMANVLYNIPYPNPDYEVDDVNYLDAAVWSENFTPPTAYLYDYLLNKRIYVVRGD